METKIRVVIPVRGFGGARADHAKNVADGAPERDFVFQGELLQFYIVIPPLTLEACPWLGHPQEQKRSRFDFADDDDLDSKSSSSAAAAPARSPTAAGAATMSSPAFSAAAASAPGPGFVEIDLGDSQQRSRTVSRERTDALGSGGVLSGLGLTTVPLGDDTSSSTAVAAELKSLSHSGGASLAASAGSASSGGVAASESSRGSSLAASAGASAASIAITACACEFDIRLSGADSPSPSASLSGLSEAAAQQSMLTHFHADAHSSPGLREGSRAPRRFQFYLPSGELVVGLETIISIGNTQDLPPLRLDVSPIPPQFEHTRSVLSAFSAGTSLSERALSLRNFVAQSRQVHYRGTLPPASKLVAVLQPLKVTCSHTLCGDKVCLTVGVENVHDSIDVTVTDLDLHLNRTRYSMRNVHDNHSELATLPLATFFNLYLDKDQLPVVLRPQERQNFVFFVESLPAARAMLSRIDTQFRTRFTVTWTCAQLSVPVLLQQKLTWTKPQHHSIMLSLRNESPVPVFRSFTVYANVANHDSVAHNFSIVILPSSHALVVQHKQQQHQLLAGRGHHADREEKRHRAEQAEQHQSAARSVSSATASAHAAAVAAAHAHAHAHASHQHQQQQHQQQHQQQQGQGGHGHGHVSSHKSGASSPHVHFGPSLSLSQQGTPMAGSASAAAASASSHSHQGHGHTHSHGHGASAAATPQSTSRGSTTASHAMFPFGSASAASAGMAGRSQSPGFAMGSGLGLAPTRSLSGHSSAGAGAGAHSDLDSVLALRGRTTSTATVASSAADEAPAAMSKGAEALKSIMGSDFLRSPEASILCLETSLYLGVLEPGTSSSVSLHFLALREGLLELGNIFLYDETEDQYYAPRKAPTVFALAS